MTIRHECINAAQPYINVHQVCFCLPSACCRGCKRPASAEAERPPLSAVAMNGSPITRSGRVRRSTGSVQQRGQSSQQRQRQDQLQQQQQQQQQHEQQQRAVRPRTRLQTAGGGAGRSCLGPAGAGSPRRRLLGLRQASTGALVDMLISWSTSVCIA